MIGRTIQLLICKPAGARDDFTNPALTGWNFEEGIVYGCDGDVLKVAVSHPESGSWAYDWTKNIPAIDCSVYKYAIVRFRLVSFSGTFRCVLRGSAGGDKVLFDETTETGKWQIKVVDASSMGTTQVWFYVGDNGGGGGSAVAEIDFYLFTSEDPFYDEDDLDQVYDVPQWKSGLNGQADFLQLLINNLNGVNKTRFAYRDEVYLWAQKDAGEYYRLFGGYVDDVNPESKGYSQDYLTLTCIGWDALLYERDVAASYVDENADDVALDILDLAEKQHPLGLTTFGVKDVQRKVPVLKCDYDPALSKLVELAEQLDCAVHVEANRDVSLYPAGKRFLRYAGWMERFWEKGWACTAKEFSNDEIAIIKTAEEGGSGTLYRVTLLSLDSLVFKKFLMEFKGDSADTKYTVKVVTADDAEYTVQAETAAPTAYTVQQWDLTPIITGANKTVKNVKLLISKTGSQGTLYFKWLGFFPATPPNCGEVHSMTAEDTSEQNNHGIINSAVETDGKYGKALNFDGIDDYVSLGNPTSLGLGKIYTLMCWFKTSFSQTNYQRLISTYGYPPLRSLDLDFWYDGKVSLFDRDAEGSIHVPSGITTEDGIWHQVAAVSDGVNAKIYVDGVLKNTVSYTPSGTTSTGGWFIGGESPSSGFFNGIIDEVRIYNRALSEPEINQAMNNNAPRNGLIGEWKFDVQGQKITLDSASNVKAGAFIRDPKKARNMIMVKGDKFVYNVPLNADEWCEKPAPTIIEEDNVGFWAYGSGGSGSLGIPSVSADTAIKAAGAQSTKVIVGAGSYGYWCVSHAYSPAQDFSSHHRMFLWWYGANTGATINFELKTGNEYADWWIVDNFTGWKRFIFDLDYPDYKTSGFDIKSISCVQFFGQIQGTWRFDEVFTADQRFCWQSTYCTLTADSDAKVGTKCLKAVLGAGPTSDFQRKSSGFVLSDPFNTLDLTKYDKGYAGLGDGNSYVAAGKLVNKVKSTVWDVQYYRWIVTKDLKSLNGLVVEAKLLIDEACFFASCLLLGVEKMASGDSNWLNGLDHIRVFGLVSGSDKLWMIQDCKAWEEPVTLYDSGASPDNPTTMTVKVIITANNIKVYFDDELVCNTSRVTDFINAYLYLLGSIDYPEYHYPKIDDLKIYAGLKIYVEGLTAGWKVELWSGTYASPGSKQAEATVPGDSSIAELDVPTLTFPFTGFFKVFNTVPAEDHHSPDYSDIWGGDVYTAKQTTQVEHLIYFPSTKDLAINALALKRLKFWLKHSLAEGESARLILATDDNNYYYVDFQPTTKWKEQFSFDVGFMQNIEFEEVGNPQLKNLNYVGILYQANSQIQWVKINELHFEGESESWGIASDEDSINEIGFQPEKVFTSAYKTPEQAQAAADYFLSILKTPPLVKGSISHPWGLLPIHSGDSAIVNVPNQNVVNEEMIIQEVACRIPPACTILPMDINVAGLPSALTDPQKRIKEWIERLERADVYADQIELVAALKDEMSIIDEVSVLWEYLLTDDMVITDSLIADIEATLSDSMAITDYLQGRHVWDEFTNMNDWTSRKGTWSISSGWLQETGGVAQLNICEYTGTNQFPVDFFVEWINYISTENASGGMGMLLRWDGEYASNEDGYALSLVAAEDKVYLYKLVNGAYTLLASADKTISLSTNYTVKVSMKDEGTGVRFKVWFQTETSPCINYLQDPKTRSSGKIAMIAYDDTGKFDYCHQWTE